VAFGEVLIGDAYSGKHRFLDATTFTEFGNTMQAVMTAPPLHKIASGCLSEVLNWKSKAGPDSILGKAAIRRFMIDYSKDGGRTFNDLQRFSQSGKSGVSYPLPLASSSERRGNGFSGLSSLILSARCSKCSR